MGNRKKTIACADARLSEVYRIYIRISWHKWSIVKEIARARHKRSSNAVTSYGIMATRNLSRLEPKKANTVKGKLLNTAPRKMSF